VAEVREKVKTHEKQESEDNIDSFYEPGIIIKHDVVTIEIVLIIMTTLQTEIR
jgi:hypothetical protein